MEAWSTTAVKRASEKDFLTLQSRSGCPLGGLGRVLGTHLGRLGRLWGAKLVQVGVQVAHGGALEWSWAVLASKTWSFKTCCFS